MITEMARVKTTLIIPLNRIKKVKRQKVKNSINSHQSKCTSISWCSNSNKWLRTCRQWDPSRRRVKNERDLHTEERNQRDQDVKVERQKYLTINKSLSNSGKICKTRVSKWIHKGIHRRSLTRLTRQILRRVHLSTLRQLHRWDQPNRSRKRHTQSKSRNHHPHTNKRTANQSRQREKEKGNTKRASDTVKHLNMSRNLSIWVTLSITWLQNKLNISNNKLPLLHSHSLPTLSRGKSTRMTWRCTNRKWRCRICWPSLKWKPHREYLRTDINLHKEGR